MTLVEYQTLVGKLPFGKCLPTAVYVFREAGSDYEVVIEMDAWLTDILRGRRWHPSQVWTELPGGGSHLRMRLSCLEEIEQWVLSWGTRATVIAPQELRERLFRTTEELWQRYGGPMVLHGGSATGQWEGKGGGVVQSESMKTLGVSA